METDVLLYCCHVGQLLHDARASTMHWLSDDEALRLRGFTAERRRDQFIAGRWLARRALVARGGGTVHDWQLSAQPDAPPTVEGGPCIGLAHSGDLVACVLSEQRVGVDVESPARRRLDVAALSELSLNEEERDAVMAAVDPLQAYLARWTLKEAFIKQHGGRPNLPDIATAACAADVANARVWQSPQCTLSLVGVAADVVVQLVGEQAPQVPASTWHVVLTSA